MTSRKHKSLSISEKKRVIQAVQEGHLKKDVAKHFGILPSTLSMILKNQDCTIGNSLSGNRKRIRQGAFPRLEDCLIQWIHQCRGQNVPVDGLMVKEKAKSLAESLGIEEFSASEGWLSNFKKRHGISFKKICGENEWSGKLKQLLKEYEPRNIFNTGETGLFYKCLPDRTLMFKDEKCHGGKLSKHRLTVLLACNMDGSQKLKPLIIGQSAKPRCFKGIKSLPTAYKANENSWMTTVLFNEWLISVNRDMKKENRKILLFLDNCAVHTKPPPLDHIKLIFFPANTTSRLQPLNQGIIQNVKTLYRRGIVSLVMDSINTGEKVNISVLRAIIMIDKAWTNVNATTIYNCFRRCGFKQDENVEESCEPPIMIKWELVPNCDELTFENYVQVDDDISVYGIPTDTELLETPNLDEDEQPPIKVTLREARNSLTNIRFYGLLRSKTSDDFFAALNTIENTLDMDKQKSLPQAKITDYFSAVM